MGALPFIPEYRTSHKYTARPGIERSPGGREIGFVEHKQQMIFITRAKKLCKLYNNPALILLPCLAAKPWQHWGSVSGSKGTCSGGCSLGVPLQNEPGRSSCQPSLSSSQAFPLLNQGEGAALHSDIFPELLTSHRNR